MYTIYKCLISWSLTVFKISKSRRFFGGPGHRTDNKKWIFENIKKKKLGVLSVFIVPKIVISILPFLRNSAIKKRENTNKKKETRYNLVTRNKKAFRPFFRNWLAKTRFHQNYVVVFIPETTICRVLLSLPSQIGPVLKIPERNTQNIFFKEKKNIILIKTDWLNTDPEFVVFG